MGKTTLNVWPILRKKRGALVRGGAEMKRHARYLQHGIDLSIHEQRQTGKCAGRPSSGRLNTAPR